MKYLVHLDGPLPNLALMRLSAYFKGRGDTVRLLRHGDRRTLFDGPGELYGSTIFEKSVRFRAAFEKEWGPVKWGGTGFSIPSNLSEVDPSADWESIAPDYSIYPGFEASLGFTQRGCRLRCGFCVVPKKEGTPRSVRTIAEIWRGDPHPRHVHLLDNDFFGQPEQEWRARLVEIREGGFKVCFSQGINIRLVDEASARELATLEYRDSTFQRRRLYTAWDNLGEEKTFAEGVATLEAAGVPARHLMVYMLIGYKRGETQTDVFHRFNKLVSLGCRPFPMVFETPGRKRSHLKAFQFWVNNRNYLYQPWDQFQDPRKSLPWEGDEPQQPSAGRALE